MSKPSQSDIAKHAYQLWEREGRPHGRDKDHWHAAEREVLGAATAQEDRPIGEIRSAQQASARPSEQQADPPPSSRQTGAVSPGRPAQPGSPGVTQAAAAAGKRVPQAQGEQPTAPSQQAQASQAPTNPAQAGAEAGRTAGAKPRQTGSGAKPPSSSAARKPRGGSKQSDM